MAPRATFAAPLTGMPVWLPFVGLLGVFGVATVGAVVLAIVAQVAGAEVVGGDPPQGVLIGGALIQDVAMVLGAYALTQAWTTTRVRPSTLGWRPVRWGPALGWGLGIYATFWAFAALYSLLLGEPPEQQLVTDLRSERSILVLAGFAVVVGVLAPVAEEVFFRGLLFGALRDRWRATPAIVVGGTVFGLVHVVGTPVASLGVLVALGIGLCLLCWKTGSIIPGMVLHALHNAITFGVTIGAGPLLFAGIVTGGVLAVLTIAIGVLAWERRMT